jgi:excinuclease ABC subunit C
MQNPTLELQIQTLPDGPAFINIMIRTENIIYVGKAKNLKRVSSYFNKIHDTAKTNVLVKKIVTIKHIVVPTETDALLLEKI